MKLPKLYLPKFAGDVTKFRTFWDSFDSAINQNPDLSAINKFNYLKMLLDGPTASTIQGLTLSKENYEAALELIQEHYSKSQQVIATHMDKLLKIPVCAGGKITQVCAV